MNNRMFIVVVAYLTLPRDGGDGGVGERGLVVKDEYRIYIILYIYVAVDQPSCTFTTTTQQYNIYIEVPIYAPVCEKKKNDLYFTTKLCSRLSIIRKSP